RCLSSVHRAALSLAVVTDPTPAETYTLSLHDALPIWAESAWEREKREQRETRAEIEADPFVRSVMEAFPGATLEVRQLAAPEARSEEHTSELQSRENLVCRLLLEKKKKKLSRQATGAR